MNITIKKLTPELVHDYINFFDNVAFTDNKEWAGCYCVSYHWNNALEQECNEYKKNGGTCFNRNLAMRYIQNNTIRGYLAYVDDMVVGWCNANDISNYDALSKEESPELWENSDDKEKIKSIVCYTIAPDMRRNGIATHLLERVCTDALAEGYTIVEAYPFKGDSTRHKNYHGPYALYEKFGFVCHKELEGFMVVRKYL